MSEISVPPRPTARQMHARVSLLDTLPLPTETQIARKSAPDDITLYFANIADAQEWTDRFGAETWASTTSTTYQLHTQSVDWEGWTLYITGVETRTEPDRLDADTRDALTALVDGAVS